MSKENQIELEKLFIKNQLIDRLTQEFTHLTEDKFILNLLVQMTLHKQTNVETLVGLLHKHFVTKNVDISTACQQCADRLLLAAEEDWVDYDFETKNFIVKYDISQDVRDEIEKYQYPLPMIIKPKTITHNKESGYLTIDISILLKSKTNNNDVNLDHINTLNKIPLSVNSYIINNTKNNWKNIDKPQQDESIFQYKQRVKNYNTYVNNTKDITNALVIAGNKFYITNRYDKRGRTYSSGYHINPQGNQWNKAAIEFYNKELIND
jgi:hypothetical protein